MSEVNPTTREEIVAEILKCAKQPAYFLTNHAFIQHPTKGLIPFRLFPFQEDLVKGFSEHRKNIVLKARQLGATTTVAGYIAWLVLLHRDKNVLILATKQKTAQNMIRVVKNIVKNLPKWMKQMGKIKIDNRQSIELANGSRVTALATSSDTGRSEAVSLLVCDECAFIPNFNEIWTGVSPTVSAGGSVILLSTPNGTGNKFHELYEGAQLGINGFNCKYGTYTNPYDSTESYNDRFMWWVHPNYDLEWFENETRDKNKRQIAQEYECFEENTRIFTETGLRKIKDLSIGDKVLTHKGNFKPVTFVKSKKVNNCLEIKTFNNRIPTIVTHNHPLLSVNKEWKNTEDFSVNDSVCSFPKNTKLNDTIQEIDLFEHIKSKFFKLKLTQDENQIYINDRKHKTKINRFIKVDYDLGKLIGLYLAEGYSALNYINFSFNYETELNTLALEICDIAKRKFGFDKPKIYKSSKSKAATIQLNSQILRSLFSKLTKGKDCYNKGLSSFSYSLANEKYFAGILDGFFQGDGCLGFSYDKKMSTTSEEILYDIKYIASFLNNNPFSTTIARRPKISQILGRTVNIADSYLFKFLKTRNKDCKNVSELIFEKSDTSYKSFYETSDDFNTTKIISKKIIDDVEYDVYDIEVEEDHSFVTEHFVAHNCAYNASGETFLMPEELDALRKRGRDPLSIHSIDRHIWIWKQPERSGTYIIASDVSRGDAADYSAFHVLRIDQDKIEQVCEYKGKIKPDQLGTLLMQVSRMYNDATVAPENNNGWAGQTIAAMEQVAFPHIYYSRKRKPKEKDSFVVDAQYAMYRNDYAPGYAVTSANRNQMLAKVEQYIRNGDIVLYSKRLISEFETFIVTEFGRPEAQRGKSDDLVMALAGALWIHDESFKRSYRGEEITVAMLSAISVNTTTTQNIPQFNRFNTLTNEREKAIIDYDASTNQARTNRGDTWDFSWLITKG